MTRTRLVALALGLPLLAACHHSRPPAALPFARMSEEAAAQAGEVGFHPAITGEPTGAGTSAPASGARAEVPRYEPPATATASAPASASGDLAKDVPGTVLAAMDAKANPCDDFYRYACGGWIDTTKRPADREIWGRGFSVIADRNLDVERAILEEAAKPGATTDAELAKAGRYYAACMDEVAIEHAGAAPLEPFLRRISSLQTPDEAFRFAAELHMAQVQAFFASSVDADFKDPSLNIAHITQGGLGLPDRDYYLKTDEKSEALRKDYATHVERMLTLAGTPTDGARADAAAVLAFETELAKVSLPREDLRDPNATYHKIDVAGLEKLAPALAWRAFFTGAGYPDLNDVNVAVPAFYEGINKIVPSAPIATLRAYLRWQLAHGLARGLSKAFVDENFDFFGKKMRGAKEQLPRWKRCVNDVDGAVGEILGRAFVEKKFAGDSKTKALDMIRGIEGAFSGGLPKLAWMDETTRGRALEKMNAITNKIGYPDRWRDYGALQVGRTSHFENAIASRRFDFDFNMNKVGKPLDRGEWGMTPPTVNAYYNPSINEIVFPAGIMQAPFFDRAFPAPMNFGGIGMVMGHELTHGFDDEGRKFDSQGRLREWWDPKVSTAFDVAAKCVDDLYSGFEVEPGVKVNGKLTLGENIADVGGLKEAFKAYRAAHKGQGKEPSGVGTLNNDQLFFVGFAQTWCELATPEIMRMLVTVDEHSPAKFRVNAPVSNLPEFGEAFSCAVGTPMRPKSMCLVW